MKIRNSLLLISVAFALIVAAACSKPAQKRYHLTGRVISTDHRSHSVMVDGDDIPGFMAAMTMPYTVKDDSLLDKLAPGDQITADVVVSGDQSWLENIVVVGHTAPPKPTTEMHIPAPGEAVPDFKFVNQDGQNISLQQYRGKALLLTFIYTRCPFPNFCPRVSHEFAEINRELQSDSALSGKTHLLSITFDPTHDTPKVLRAYGFSCVRSKQPSLFHHWEFVAPRAADLPAIAKFFAVSYSQDGNVINHSLSTVVIGPDGRIFKWYHGADWQSSELVKDAADALHTNS